MPDGATGATGPSGSSGTAEPTPEQLAIAKRVGNRLSEKMPSQGVMDWTDVQQFALEVLLELLRDGKAPEEPAHLSVVIRSRTIDKLRKHGTLVRLTDGSYMEAEAPDLDALPQHIRDALLWDDETPSQREVAPGRKPLQALRTKHSKPTAAAAYAHKARRGVSGELTEREIEALAGRADGHSEAEVGKLLGIGPDTVKNHLARARFALRARSTTHAVAIAFRRGLLS